MKYFIVLLVLCFYSCSQVKVKHEQSSNLFSEHGDIVFYDNTSIGAGEIQANKKLKERINYWIDIFTGRFKENFQTYLNRGNKYNNLIVDILREHKLPEELFFLPLIESGYHLKAKSHASAIGPWQFIKSTGAHYGLEINQYIDERKDIIKSTQAAATHLRDLYNIFGS